MLYRHVGDFPHDTVIRDTSIGRCTFTRRANACGQSLSTYKSSCRCTATTKRIIAQSVLRRKQHCLLRKIADADSDKRKWRATVPTRYGDVEFPAGRTATERIQPVGSDGECKLKKLSKSLNTVKNVLNST